MYQEYNNKEKENLEKYSNLIKDFVETGTHILKHAMDSRETLRTDLPSYFLFRQVLEAADAIRELVKTGCINASKPILRTLLECYFQMKYLFESDYDRKALQLLYHNEIRKRDYYENLASPNKGGSFYRRLNNDKHLKGIDISLNQKKIYIDNVRKANEMISHVDYLEIKKEYDKIETDKTKERGKNYKVKYWYELFDGPKDAERLMIKLKESGLYEFIYRDCSSYAHGEDIIHPNLEPNDEVSLRISFLRDVRQLIDVGNNAIMLTERSCLLFLKNKVNNPKSFVEKLGPLVHRAREFEKTSE